MGSRGPFVGPLYLVDVCPMGHEVGHDVTGAVPIADLRTKGPATYEADISFVDISTITLPHFRAALKT